MGLIEGYCIGEDADMPYLVSLVSISFFDSEINPLNIFYVLPLTYDVVSAFILFNRLRVSVFKKYNV
jgi:hypothetical protein